MRSVKAVHVPLYHGNTLIIKNKILSILINGKEFQLCQLYRPENMCNGTDFGHIIEGIRVYEEMMDAGE